MYLVCNFRALLCAGTS